MILTHLILLGLIDGAGGGVTPPAGGGDGMCMSSDISAFGMSDWEDVDAVIGVYAETESFGDVFWERC